MIEKVLKGRDLFIMFGDLVGSLKGLSTLEIRSQLVRASTLNEWRNYGEILKRVDEAKQWAIGDWLVDGKRYYRDGVYKEAEKIVGIDQSGLMKLKSIAERFEILLHSKNLTWNHHYEVSSLKLLYEDKNGKLHLSDKPDTEKMQEFLQKAEKENWSIRELREAVNRYKRRQQYTGDSPIQTATVKTVNKPVILFIYFPHVH